MFRFLTLLVVAAVALPCAADGASGWWNAEWQSRKLVHVELPEFAEPAPLQKLCEPEPEFGRIVVRAMIQRELPGPGDNSDVRVVDLDGNLLPAKVRPADAEGLTEVLFPAHEKSADYYIYYDNPNAGPPPQSDWTPSANSIRYATVRHDGAPGFELSSVLNGIEAGFEVLSRQKFNMIAGLYQVPRTKGNRGEAGKLFSTFEAYLYCPMDGRYDFSVDNKGSSYVLIDGELVVEARALYPTPRTWPQPDNVVLKAGYHHLRLVLISEGQGQRIRFGWSIPGARTVKTVNPRNYAKYIDASITGFERLDGVDRAFFSYSIPPEALILSRGRASAREQSLIPPDTEVPAAYTTFQNLSTLAGSDGVSYRWQFEQTPMPAQPRAGGGENGSASFGRVVSQEHSPGVFLQLGKSYNVQLEVLRDGAVVDTYSRKVSATLQGAGRLARASGNLDKDDLVYNVIKPWVEFEVLQAPNIVYQEEKTSVSVRVVSNLNHPVPFDWSVRVSSQDESRGSLGGSFLVGAGTEVIKTFPLDLGEFSGGEGEMTISASVLGTQMRRVDFALVPSPSEFSNLVVQETHLVRKAGDAAPQRVIICSTYEDEAKYRKWMFLKYAARKLDRSSKRVLLFGSPMMNAPQPGQVLTGYFDHLRQLVKDDTASFDFVRRGGGLSPVLSDIATLSGWLNQNDPQVAVICPGLQEVELGASLDDYGRGLDVLIDLLRARGHYVKIVLVSPPPLVSNPQLSKLYRDMTRRIAKTHHAAFVDIHSTILKQDRWQDAYTTSPGSPVHQLYPNEATQKLIAEQIADEL